MGRFIDGLRTKYPDQDELLTEALDFSSTEIREDRKVLLSKELHKPTKSPRLDDIDPEAWVKSLPLPHLILLGHRSTKLRPWSPFETPCRPLWPLRRTLPQVSP